MVASAEPVVQAAIALHFQGDAALYADFAAACAEEFQRDIAAGRRACRDADLCSLQRVAHNLKSALLMLGHADLHQAAQWVESLAAGPDVGPASAAWGALARRLQSLPGQPE